MSDKMIIASFGKTRTARTATQYQYNHGQRLQFENVDLPANYEVHFSNSVNGEAKTVIGDSTGVVIPPEYFIPGSTIYAWIYVTDEDSGITIRKVEIPISVKAKPTDQPLESEDESLVEQIVNRLNETIDEIPNEINQALEEAKESGEFNGPKGDPFTYDDFTPEQLEELKGPKGDSFTYDDFTPEQLEELKGPKGDSFTYGDFTPEELDELKGPQGPEGSTIWATNTPYSYSQETGRYYFAASNLRGPTTATKKLYDLVYLSDDTNKEYKAFYIVEFQYGGLQVGCRYLANMQGPPGEGATGSVLYSRAQTLSENEKNMARQNIGAASISDIGTVFRLKGDVAVVADLPSTGNTPGDVYYIRNKQVGYVWIKTQFNPDGRWEELGEPIDLRNLPNTICWFAGSVNKQGVFTPNPGLTARSIDYAIVIKGRIPYLILDAPDGDIWLSLRKNDRMNAYSFDATVGTKYYEVTLKKISVDSGDTWRYGYTSENLATSNTVGLLANLNTQDKSSIVNAINELAESGSSDVAVFDFIISLENDEYIITRHPEYDDVYSAFESGKIVIARIRYMNGSVWTDYRFIGNRVEVFDSIDSSTISFSCDVDKGIYLVIQARKSGTTVYDWAAFIDDTIPSYIDSLESDISEKYTKPDDGIPKTDLASDVQTSLGKANTALQEVDARDVLDLDQYIDSQGYAKQSWVRQQGYLTQHQDISGKLDKEQGAANAGKIMTVNSSGVVVPEDNRFVVTLTPTAQDFSGVMDKTCAEITAAYEAGKDIWLEVDATAMGYDLWRVKATIEAKVSGENYGQVMGFLINLQLTPPSMIFIFTEFNTSGDENRYTTQIYPLATGQWTGGSY